MMQQTLVRLGYAGSDIQEYMDVVRRDHYDLSISTFAEQQALSQMRASAIGPRWSSDIQPAGDTLVMETRAIVQLDKQEMS